MYSHSRDSSLDDDVARDPSTPVCSAPLNEDSITDQLLQAAFLDAEESAGLVHAYQGHVSTRHDRKTTPRRRRSDTRISVD